MFVESCWTLDTSALQGGRFQIQVKDFYHWAFILTSSISNLSGDVYWAVKVYGV